MTTLKSIRFLVVLLVFLSCKKETKNNESKQKYQTTVKYAKGFDIIRENGEKKLIIKSPYKNASKEFEYLISREKNSTKNKQLKTITVPVKNIVVTSTTHIPMIELLDSEQTIVGFPFSKYVSSEKTRQRIDNGYIKEIGKDNALNTEILIYLQPELVVGFSISGADKSLTTVQKSGIDVIYNGDWLEASPLGRAEWIKFFGVLFDKEAMANRIFKNIEQNYKNAQQLIKTKLNKPKVLSGAIMNNDVWNLPAGNSFEAQFLEDAQLDYYWKNSDGKGSLSLSLESVLDKAQNADFWFSPGYFTSKKQMLANNELYKEFAAFQKGEIYSSSIKKGTTGGIIYYELAPTRPDLVLKDLIKITNPKLLPDYQLTFFEKMK